MFLLILPKSSDLHEISLSQVATDSPSWALTRTYGAELALSTCKPIHWEKISACCYMLLGFCFYLLLSKNLLIQASYLILLFLLQENGETSGACCKGFL